MKKILELYKKEGETPLETIERYKRENLKFARQSSDGSSRMAGGYKDEKMTYAGRLDPMAEGVLLVLVGEECKNKEKYLGLDKEYEFEILWGFQTDTYDILGIPKCRVQGTLHFEEEIKSLKGKLIQKYPPYSSMTVRDCEQAQVKPLFQWAREGRLDEIEIPEQEVEIYDIEILGNRELSSEDLKENILNRINKVKGDFRQEETKKEWKNLLTKNEVTGLPQNYLITKVKIKCSSGTYVRGIANELGGLAFSIKRTQIFTLNTF